MNEYHCPICGKQHAVYKGLRSPLPPLLTDMSERDWEQRVEQLNGMYTVDLKQLLCSAVIHIELEGQEDPYFEWEVWASVPVKAFNAQSEAMRNGERVTFDGILLSALPFYPASAGLDVTVIVDPDARSMYEVKVEEDSELKTDQSAPISPERVVELMTSFYHPAAAQGAEVFTAPFAERLRTALDEVEEQYIGQRMNWALNISSPTLTLFQALSGRMLERQESRQAGFGIHLSFDLGRESGEEEYGNFLAQPYAKDFHFHEWDNLPTYQLNLGLNKKAVEEIVSRLIVDVYAESVESIGFDHYAV